jgi:hypothetical protein
VDALSNKWVFFIYIYIYIYIYYIPVVMLAVEYIGITTSMNMLGKAVQIICNRTSMGCLRIKYVIYPRTYTLPGVQLACLPRCLCIVRT